MNNDVLNSVLGIVRSCDDLQLCTFGLGKYPETRHIMNGMNQDATNLVLHFLTNVHSPKYAQILKNPHCCLYYFNPTTRHAVRLFGKMEIINDAHEKEKHWHDDYSRFGYDGWQDADFALMRFIPAEYKFYIGNELKFGKIH